MCYTSAWSHETQGTGENACCNILIQELKFQNNKTQYLCKRVGYSLEL
jgi:hypothetical protein